MAKKRSKKWKEPDAECKTCENKPWCNHDKVKTPCDAFKQENPASPKMEPQRGACLNCGTNNWDNTIQGTYTCKTCESQAREQCLDMVRSDAESAWMCRQDAKPCAVPCRFAAKNAAEAHAKKKLPVACDQSDPRPGDVLICKVTGTSCNGSRLAGKCVKKGKAKKEKVITFETVKQDPQPINLDHLEKARAGTVIPRPDVVLIQSKRKAGKPGKASPFTRLF